MSLPRAVLFDLDGTLIDAAPDLADALGGVFAAHGLNPLSADTVRSLVGHGVPALVAKAFKVSGATLSDDALTKAQTDMAARYAAQLTKYTTLLPGAAEVVRAIAAAGIATAVVTNKPEAMAREILTHFGLMAHLSFVIGGDSGVAKKPSPEPLLLALKQMGVAPQDAWMVGDGLPDLGAAKAAGVMAIAVPSDYGEPFDPLTHAQIAVADMDALRSLLAFLMRSSG